MEFSLLNQSEGFSPGYPDILEGAQDVHPGVCQNHPGLGRVLYRELRFPALQQAVSLNMQFSTPWWIT